MRREVKTHKKNLPPFDAFVRRGVLFGFQRVDELPPYLALAAVAHGAFYLKNKISFLLLLDVAQL